MLAELAALLSLTLLPALPDVQEIQIPDTKVVVRIDSPWPKALNKGWLPVFVHVENGEDSSRWVNIRGDCWNVDREISASIELAAHQSGSIELLVPAFPEASNAVRLLLETYGNRTWTPGTAGAENSAGPDQHAVLVLDSELPPAGTAERWTSEVSTAVAANGGGGIRHGLVTLGYPSAPASTAAAAAPDNIAVQAARFDQMPARSEAYSSLDVVVLDTTHGLPEAQRLQPLLAWAKLGGSLLVVGPRAQSLARSIPELARWMEPRFELKEGSDGTPLPSGTAWMFALGWLFIDESAAIDGADQILRLRERVGASSGLVADPSGSRMSTPPTIPDLFALPLKVFALFLIVFAALIGPLNFVLVKRTKRPALLLLTIPAIALTAALVLLGVGIASQGLGIKIASETLVLLDQREHRASSAEQRMIFAGLSPGAGLVPGPGTSCYPGSTYLANGRYDGPEQTSRQYRINQTDGLVLSGAFIPSRTAFLQSILSEHAERARLGVKRQGEKLEIENGLGAEIQTLVLRDESGAYHKLASSLAESASAELVPIDEATAFGWGADLFGNSGPLTQALPPGSYWAELEHSPFGDDCGVSGKEVQGAHHLLGVLALDAEEWR
ncbi:MAG TPA: hypothetical protein VK843_22620 [Planctomycetota bacterium]|nr:hypothetical protein [Planctomycetota bacterium]